MNRSIYVVIVAIVISITGCSLDMSKIKAAAEQVQANNEVSSETIYYNGIAQIECDKVGVDKTYSLQFQQLRDKIWISMYEKGAKVPIFVQKTTYVPKKGFMIRGWNGIAGDDMAGRYLLFQGEKALLGFFKDSTCKIKNSTGRLAAKPPAKAFIGLD